MLSQDHIVLEKALKKRAEYLKKIFLFAFR